MNYTTYIESPEWQVKRKHALDRAKNRCQHCYRRDELEVHHLTYERLGYELDEDLAVLCARCHNDIHFALRLKLAGSDLAVKAIAVTEEEFYQRFNLWPAQEHEAVPF